MRRGPNAPDQRGSGDGAAAPLLSLGQEAVGQMASVVLLEDYRDGPWWTFRAVCRVCWWSWQAVAPEETARRGFLECRRCGYMAGFHEEDRSGL